jgi:hypothetical protein
MSDAFPTAGVFSAQVNLPGAGSRHKVRVLVSDGVALLFAAAADDQPELAASAALDGEPSRVGGRWYLPTADGPWEVLGPCGCASAAKRWDSRRLLQLAGG